MEEEPLKENPVKGQPHIADAVPIMLFPLDVKHAPILLDPLCGS